MQWSQVVFIDNVGLEIWNYLYIVLYILTTRNVIGTLVYYEFRCATQDKETMFTKNIIVYINTSCDVIHYIPTANGLHCCSPPAGHETDCRWRTGCHRRAMGSLSGCMEQCKNEANHIVH